MDERNLTSTGKGRSTKYCFKNFASLNDWEIHLTCHVVKYLKRRSYGGISQKKKKKCRIIESAITLKFVFFIQFCIFLDFEAIQIVI